MNLTIAASARAPGFLGKHDYLLINGWARHTGWLHGIMKLYAGDGIALFVAFLGVGWWLARSSGSARRMGLAVSAGIATLLAVAINQPIVHAVHEARPYVTLPHVFLLASRSADASFPSDHATMAGAVAIGLLLLSRRLGLIAIGAGLLLAFARVYIGAHYPRDVVAGLILGFVVALITAATLLSPLTRLIERLSRTRLRPLLTARRDGDVAAAGPEDKVPVA